MKLYSKLTIMVSLVFTLITIIFVLISALLIYSLLMITTESKRFENGLMRVVGLTKKGYAGMILLQSLLFVLPSVLLAFILVIPSLYFLFGELFTAEMGF